MRIIIQAETQEERESELFGEFKEPLDASNALIYIGEQFDLLKMESEGMEINYSVSTKDQVQPQPGR